VVIFDIRVHQPGTRGKDMERILRLPEVKTATGKSRSSIYLGVANGTFPAPVALGPRSVGWRESELTAWLDSLRTKAENK
jgi:prophage regulatory protein